MMMKKMIFVAMAALAVAACGDTEQNAHEVRNQAGVAIDEGALVKAIGSAVDEEAVKGLARGAIEGAVNETLRGVLPAEEIAILGAVVDEQALAKGLENAVEGQAIGKLMHGAIERASDAPGFGQ